MKLFAGLGLALGLILGIALTPGVGHAQDTWPERPITFVVPYAPGGYTDLVARLTARYVEKELGKSVIVETRPGAGGIVGTQAVVNAAPDGYTFCVCSVGAVSVAPFAQKVSPNTLAARKSRLASAGSASSLASTIPSTVSGSLSARSSATARMSSSR